MSREYYTEVIRNAVAEKVSVQALGNSNRSMKDLAIDLINASNLSYADIADGSFLCTTTVKKLAMEITRFPRMDTIERIYKFFGVDMKGDLVTLQSKFENKPKAKR